MLTVLQSDDTSVAILERPHGSPQSQLHFHEKVTADNRAYHGIHPAVSVASHQRNLAKLINKGLQSLPGCDNGREGHGVLVMHDSQSSVHLMRKKPDFISVTRGPGIMTALSTGLETAKGLAVAWQIPFIGVNHMQAHAVTPRLARALARTSYEPVKPQFPYLSLLVSGGHTLLLNSKSLCEHEILASTVDIAIGDALDKVARNTLTADELVGHDVMYGKVLERFAFGDGTLIDEYVPPCSRAEEIKPRPTRWGWSLPVPLSDTRNMAFSFTGLGSAVKRICEAKDASVSRFERMELARESMRIAFEHLASRVVWALDGMKRSGVAPDSLVVSGGVASNKYLRAILQSFLKARGFGDVHLVCPPLELCTDNAAMIAWTGMEMYDQGWRTDLSCHALRKWSLDPTIDGGILGVEGWRNVRLPALTAALANDRS